MRGLERDKGFTLVELICAIGIILIMLVALCKHSENYTNKIKTTQAQTELYILQNAIKAYVSTVGFYPETGNNKEGLYKTLSGQNAKNKNFIFGYDWNVENNKLLDPWGKPYVFDLTEKVLPNKQYNLLSTGPNGEQESEIDFQEGKSDDIYSK